MKAKGFSMKMGRRYGILCVFGSMKNEHYRVELKDIFERLRGGVIKPTFLPECGLICHVSEGNFF